MGEPPASRYDDRNRRFLESNAAALRIDTWAGLFFRTHRREDGNPQFNQLSHSGSHLGYSRLASVTPRIQHTQHLQVSDQASPPPDWAVAFQKYLRLTP